MDAGFFVFRKTESKAFCTAVKGMELSNGLNWIDWDENPVQGILCDACGFDGRA
jgi:hypothetical protein